MPRHAGEFSPVRGSRSGLAGEIVEAMKKGLTMRNDHTIRALRVHTQSVTPRIVEASQSKFAIA